MRLDLTPLAALTARRSRLADAFGSDALFFAGAARPRNYPATTYPFRASSHFLYFAGVALEHAVLRIRGGETTLYAPAPDPSDALWHGPRPSFAEMSERLGCPVRPLEALSGAQAATIVGVDGRTRTQQAAVLQRDASTPTDADRALVDAVIGLRLVHDEAAIAGLRDAAEATSAAHRAGMAASRPGMLEAGVRAAMEGELMTRGMGTAYGSIVTVHGEVLHNETHHNRLAGGDLLLADVGAETPGGWAGDVTRTWPVSPRFSATQRAMYEVVLSAQRAAIDAVAPGVRYRDVHLTAARALTEGLVGLEVLRGDVDEMVADGVHALFFPHGVGHLIGLDVHDMEDLGDRAGYAPGRTRSAQFGLGFLRLDRDLAPGMAVTIEPGFYRIDGILSDPAFTDVAGDRLDRSALARFSDVRGIRIEDDVLVTQSGHEVLTDAPKSIDDVEAAVAA